MSPREVVQLCQKTAAGERRSLLGRVLGVPATDPLQTPRSPASPPRRSAAFETRACSRSRLLVCVVLGLFIGCCLSAQQAKGSMTANGKDGVLRYAAAMEVDSETEPGYLDVRIVLSDRVLPPEVRASDERLEKMVVEEGLVALRARLNPDAKLLSAVAYHPAFTAFISSGAYCRWEPSAYDDVVAGRLYTDGLQEDFNQKWRYDVTFSAPIELDPEAVTVE